MSEKMPVPPLPTLHPLATLRLGVNIDHVATVRNSRGGVTPSPLRAAVMAQESGADGVTAHLREDRRHISDEDLYRIKQNISIPLNMEMAPTEEMLEIALAVRPFAVCLVPEKRKEVTTEGGLDVVRYKEKLSLVCQRLVQAGIRTSLFIDAQEKQIRAAYDLGVRVVELHTGAYAQAFFEKGAQQTLNQIQKGALLCQSLGIECHAGHGLTYDNVGPIARIAPVAELNIGHFLVGEAIFVGLTASIKKMRKLMDKARLETLETQSL